MHSPSVPHQILLLLAPLLCTVPAAWAQTAPPAPAVCDRTPQVRAWITGQVPGVTRCAAVTTEQLAAISADINLSRDRITTLQAGDFQGLGLIATLDLSLNDLTMLPAGVFDGLRLSGSLDLSFNDLTMLSAGLFDGLRLSGSLDLSSNDLITLPAGLFDGLSVGDTLDLSFNDLTTLPAGLFGALRLSGSLKLSFNDLTTLPVRAFDGLRIGDTLVLHSNELETLPVGVFDGLSVGDTLDLSLNGLKTLSAGVFRGLNLRGTLELDFNRLETLSAGVFEGFSITEPSGGLKLNNNPGSPFPLTVELERIGAVPSAASPAEVRLRLAEGAPFAITAPLTISVADTESSGEATLAAGATTSDPLTIMGPGATTISLGELPALPDTYRGLRLLGSAPLVLFGTADDTAPTLTHAELTSTPTRNQTYAAGEAIEVTLTFSEPVIIDTTTSRPGFSLQVGTAVREAVYISGGRGRTALVFRYRTVGGDEDSDGPGWAAEALRLNGATLEDRAGNTASLVVPAQTAATGHTVFALQVSLSGAHTSVAEGDLARIMVQVSPPPGTDLTLYYFISDDDVAETMDIHFLDYKDDNKGTIVIPAGETTAYIEFTIVNDALAELAEGFGVNLLNVRTADSSSVGRGLRFVSGTVVPDPDDAIRVSVTGPAFVREGETLRYTVALTGGTATTAVAVPWTIAGTATPGVDYTSSRSSLTIPVGQSTSRITVPTVDDGFADAGETLALTLGTPTGGGGPPAALTVGMREVHTTIIEVAVVVVDVALLSMPRSITRNAYGAGEQIIVRVRFSEAVQLDGVGMPMLALGIGTATVNAELDSQSSVGTDLVFRYTVSAMDRDTDGLRVAAIDLGSHAFGNAHRVDGSQTVAAMDLSGNDHVDIVDAKLLHYALQMQAALGDGSEGSGDAGVRAEVLGSLVQVSDAQWRGILRAVHALTPMPSPADLNKDNSVDSTDAALFYYAQALPAALGDAQLRMTILGPLYPGADDDTLQQLLEAIGRFGETP